MSLLLAVYVGIGLGVFLQLTLQDPARPEHLDEWGHFILAFFFIVLAWPVLTVLGLTRSERGETEVSDV